MADPRLYPAIGWGLAFLAVVSVGVAAAEAYLVGYPRPLSLITALLLTGTAVSWPFVSGTAPTAATRAACVECGHTAWGYSEFHFCIHCGSTRAPRHVRT